MDVAGAIRARLQADAAVSAITTRVHWVVRPQNGALPAIVLQAVGGDRQQLLDGEGGMAVSRVDVNCLASTHEKAWQLAEAARAALLPEAEIEGLLFWNASADAPSDRGEQTDTGYVHRASFEIVLRHTVVPTSEE